MNIRVNWLKVGIGMMAAGWLLLAVMGCVPAEAPPHIAFEPAAAPRQERYQPLPTREPYVGPPFRAETLALIDQGYILQELGEAVFFHGWTPDGQMMIAVNTGKPVSNADEYPKTMRVPTIRQRFLANPEGTDVRQAPLGIWNFTTNVRQTILTDTLAFLDWLDNDTLIFANRQGKLELIEADGHNRRAFVVPEIEDEWHPGFYLSPNKQWIAVYESRRITPRLWMGEIVGEQIQQFQMVRENLGHLRWSPDSSKVAYPSEASKYAKTIVVADVHGQHLAEVPIPERMMWGSVLTWSPDSNVLLFSAGQVRPPLPEPQDVWYAVNADGTGLRKLLEPVGGASVPNWSPDGQYLVYCETEPQPASAALEQLSKVRVWRVER